MSPSTGQVLWEYYSSFLDFTRNYEQTSGIFHPQDETILIMKCSTESEVDSKKSLCVHL